MIRDVPDAGFFVITLTQQREEDSGPSRSYNSSSNVGTVPRNIRLLVSQGEPLS